MKNCISSSFMMKRDDVLVRSASAMVYELPAPLNINYKWNFGSILGLYLVLQMTSGMFLSMYYVAFSEVSFESVDLIVREVNKGWFFRLIHVCGATGFFVFLYLHMARGMYFLSYRVKLKVWLSGVTMFILSMATGFLGYVLPWGQMSYWGATVITKFLSVIPYVGQQVVIWVWGGFSVKFPTLTRFYSLHYLLPFLMIVLVLVHLVFLHETGSNHPLGALAEDKVTFFPYFISKDVFGFLASFLFVKELFFLYPQLFDEPQKYMEANPLATPSHMLPEWYFLSAYAVLRAIPKKLGGVLGLVGFVFLLYMLPFLAQKPKSYNIASSVLFWVWVSNIFLLTWIGACVVEDPFISLNRLSCSMYFLVPFFWGFGWFLYFI